MGVPSTGDPIEVYRLVDGSFEALVVPDAPVGISCRIEKNGCGSGQFSLPMDDPAYEEIEINDVVAIRREGTTVLAFVVEEIDEHTLDEQGGARQQATYLGRGVGVFLDMMRIAPALGEHAKPIEDDSVWDWRSPRYNPAGDGWGAANEIMSVATAEGGAWPHQPMAEKFSLTTGAQMIGGPSGDDEYAPMGWTLFYRDIDVEETGRHAIEMLMDDLGKFWVDGIEMMDVPQSDGFVTASFKRLTLTAGVHHFCWAIYNFEDPENPGMGLGPSALAYNFYKADLQDRPLAGKQYEISDDSTQVLEVGDDPWPGMTVTKILDCVLDENYALGLTPAYWLSPSFNNTTDSNSDTVDKEVGITTKTGTTTALQFMDELVAANRVAQWRIDNDCETFHVYKPGYTNRPEPVTANYPSGATVLLEPAAVDPRTGSLVQLDRRIT